MQNAAFALGLEAEASSASPASSPSLQNAALLMEVGLYCLLWKFLCLPLKAAAARCMFVLQTVECLRGQFSHQEVGSRKCPSENSAFSRQELLSSQAALPPFYLLNHFGGWSPSLLPFPVRFDFSVPPFFLWLFGS